MLPCKRVSQIRDNINVHDWHTVSVQQILLLYILRLFLLHLVSTRDTSSISPFFSSSVPPRYILPLVNTLSPSSHITSEKLPHRIFESKYSLKVSTKQLLLTMTPNSLSLLLNILRDYVISSWNKHPLNLHVVFYAILEYFVNR